MNRRRAIWLLGAGGILAGAGAGALTSSWLNRPDPVALQPDDLPMRIVRRAEWGAAAPQPHARREFGLYDPAFNRGGWLTYGRALARTLHTIVVHHSATAATDAPRALQVLHQSTAGYADIAYHLLIGSDGIVYEGREIGVRGAHVAKHNTGAIGICVIGHFERHAPTHFQTAALNTLVLALRERYGITHLAGHRDFPDNKTICPGATLHPSLPDIAAQARLSYGPGGQKP